MFADRCLVNTAKRTLTYLAHVLLSLGIMRSIVKVSLRSLCFESGSPIRIPSLCLGGCRFDPPPDSFRWFSGLCTTFRQRFGSAKAGIHRGKLGGGLKANTVQRVAGTLRVPSADSQKALLFEGYGTWNVPTTLLR